MAQAPERISAAAYADRIGVTKARLSQYIARGLPWTPGSRGAKLIAPAEADRWRAANLDPKVDAAGRVRGLVDGGDDAGAASAERIQRAKAQAAELELKSRQLTYDRALGKLVDRSAALEVQRAFVTALAAEIDRMPANMATAIADRLGCTEHDVFKALREVADTMKGSLARYAGGQAAARRGGAMGGDGPGDRAEAAAHAA